MYSNNDSKLSARKATLQPWLNKVLATNPSKSESAIAVITVGVELSSMCTNNYKSAHTCGAKQRDYLRGIH